MSQTSTVFMDPWSAGLMATGSILGGALQKPPKMESASSDSGASGYVHSTWNQGDFITGGTKNALVPLLIGAGVIAVAWMIKRRK